MPSAFSCRALAPAARVADGCTAASIGETAILNGALLLDCSAIDAFPWVNNNGRGPARSRWGDYSSAFYPISRQAGKKVRPGKQAGIAKGQTPRCVWLIS